MICNKIKLALWVWSNEWSCIFIRVDLLGTTFLTIMTRIKHPTSQPSPHTYTHLLFLLILIHTNYQTSSHKPSFIRSCYTPGCRTLGSHCSAQQPPLLPALRLIASYSTASRPLPRSRLPPSSSSCLPSHRTRISCSRRGPWVEDRQVGRARRSRCRWHSEVLRREPRTYWPTNNHKLGTDTLICLF